MVEIGRRGFITGLAALVAAPAIIRVSPIMPISTRFTPAYVPVQWLADFSDEMWSRMGVAMEPGLVFRPVGNVRERLLKHAWPRPMGETWVDLHDYDPQFVSAFALNLENDLWPRWE